MDYIKRINLSFDLRREKDRQVYEILSLKQHKTAFIVKAVLSYETGRQNAVDNKEFIKQALREVLVEMNIKSIENKQEREEAIPDTVFDIFEQIR